MTHLTSTTQVMAKKKVESQISSLPPNHKKLGIDPTSVREGSVQHTIEKLSTRAITLV
jgi:hypothetical protein